MGEKLTFQLPLVDEHGRSKGYLYLAHQKRPKDLPRAGEKVVLLGGRDYLEGKVLEVCHSNFFNSATLRFEPVAYSWRSMLQEHDNNWQHVE